MDWKKHSWIFTLIGLAILIGIVANIDRLFGLDFANKAVYNLTNNPDGIVVEEFSDFACPFCSQARPEIYRVLNKYDGEINFMFRHFIVHPETQLAAEASECARDQGKFLEYADMLYDHQDFSRMSLEAYAANLNLNITEFIRCLDSEEKAAVIERDYQDAMNRGILGTPYFYVDGKEVPLEYLDLAIEETLNADS